MEAKDTVMSDKEMTQAAHDCWLTPLTYPKFVAVKQAEISFNAGMKEVVDFVKAHTCNLEEWTGWQEQLEEWGIE